MIPVLDTIRANPQIVVEALQILELEQQKAEAAAAKVALADQRALLENDPNAPVIGNPQGDVTVVEFFDYNCPYCRNAKLELDGLLSVDFQRPRGPARMAGAWRRIGIRRASCTGFAGAGQIW
ncbi:MAG: thioredoxin domain-containing protein [Rhodobacterales bacterium]